MKVLIVDDDEALRSAVSIMLHVAGYETCEASDGISALKIFDNASPDLVIMDVMLPRLDGFEACAVIRRICPTVPILFLSAKSDISDKAIGYQAGGDDYLTKPFAAKELLARIRAMTRAATAIDATTLSVGNMRLDTASCTLVGPLGEEHLANREFQLMELFMRNAGTRMPTERLMLEVWGEDAPEGANVVWVYISYLRKKLTALGANVAIRASRNQGYSLEVVEEGE